MASSLLAAQRQQRGAAASCAAAPGRQAGRRALGCSFSAAAPWLAAPRRSALNVLNSASGSRGSSSQQQPQPPQHRAANLANPHKPKVSPKASAATARRTSAVLPDGPSSFLINAAAGLAGGLLLTAAALHLSGDAHAAVPPAHIAGSSLAAVKEFGPADLVNHTFGPARPLWSMLLHSHAHATAVASSYVSSSHTTTAAAATAAAQHLPHATHLPHLLPDLSGAGGGVSASGSLAAPSSASELWAQARGAAQEAAGHVSEAAHGAVAQTVDGYNAWLEESPLLCKIVTGNFFTIAGDMLAQLGCAGGGGGHGAPEVSADASAATGTAAAGGRRHVNWARTTRLCLETSLVGTPLAHWWFNLLDARVLPDDPHCPAAVLTKMLLDQLLFAPLGLALFFVVIKLLEGRPADIRRSLQTSYVKSLLGGYLLWPAAGLLNFALLPNEYRLLFNNCVNIIWTCFLSVMSSADNAQILDAEPTAAASRSATVNPTALASAHTTAAMASPSPSSSTSTSASLADAPASTCASPSGSAGGGFMSGAQDLAAAAVAAAALGAACSSDRAALGAMAGLAVAVVGATCHSAANAAAPTAVPAAAPASQQSAAQVSEPPVPPPQALPPQPQAPLYVPAATSELRLSSRTGTSVCMSAAGEAGTPRPFAGGGSVQVGGPCLEVCEPERDEASS
ncbi:hypothetical protein HYH02_008461 [Chlamydomonas schloesseri]|uniref:Uncharacterized protein n=1 Tax=Chlamydomonas schloesseri TaxID=2026947 RepID=A0A835WFG8_9CHLO|nr:hypothetical protein HYH02_008461 [Chlamydomonas schloesseri]|eukprot:KAG2446470.1 hypothetical protein HYH02_008461 [Chlamydomonas schloesseri]